MKKHWLILGILVVLGAIGTIGAMNNGKYIHSQEGLSNPSVSTVKSG
ncbi:hypothetical protein PP175_08375 [Aneurinibacillus sp. Ricciae_BoGa-3]|nr:hypothetical protein [Aneurinibacillus sp. Ricciae_BoGa-3]WCK55918.1 hypothetical protein PP175_08375 [Aneurinibacillus sp. Ricciae_BoGa-3]